MGNKFTIDDLTQDQPYLNLKEQSVCPGVIKAAYSWMERKVGLWTIEL